MGKNETAYDDEDLYHTAEDGTSHLELPTSKRACLKRKKTKRGHSTDIALVLSMFMLTMIFFLALFFSKFSLPLTLPAIISSDVTNVELINNLNRSKANEGGLDGVELVPYPKTKNGNSNNDIGSRYWRRRWRSRLLNAQDNMNANEISNAKNSNATGAITDVTADFSDHSCGDLAHRTSSDDPAARCNFSRTCNDGDGGILLSFVFCHFNDGGERSSTDGDGTGGQQNSSSLHSFTILQRWSPESFCLLVSPFLLLWLVLLFRMLGSTAEECFSPSLEMFSHRCRLPPRFAGVTLLALGNGAPDISATLNAIYSNPLEGTQLSLGSLTGGGMFVGTVVAGSIFLLANDDCAGGGGGASLRCRGALVRDVMVYAVTIIVVFFEFRTGYVGRRSVYIFFGLYGAYVIAVLIADVYHRTVYIPKMKEKANRLKSKQQAQGLRQKMDETDGYGESETDSFPVIISSEDNIKNKLEGETRISQIGGDSMELLEVSDGQSSPSSSSPLSSPEGSLAHETDVGAKVPNIVAPSSILKGPIQKANAHRDERMLNNLRTSSSRMRQSFKRSSKRSLKNLLGVKNKTRMSRWKRKFNDNIVEPSSSDDGGNDLHSDKRSTISNDKEKILNQTLNSNDKREEGYEIRDPSESSALTLGDTSVSWQGPLKQSLLNISNYEATSIRLDEGPFILHGPGGVLGHHKSHNHHHRHNEQHQEPHHQKENHESYGSLLPPAVDENAASTYHDAVAHENDEPGMMQFKARKWSIFFRDGLCELRNEWDDIWDNIFDNDEINVVNKILLFCEVPFIILRKITIPIPCEGYYCRALVALSICISPLWICVYIWLVFGVNLFVVDALPYVPFAFVLTFAAGVLVLIYSPRDKMPMKFAIPTALFGFAVAATWIDLIGSYLVSLLEFLGVMCRIPSSIMGLTVLAWGNSMGDLSTNVTMARKGLANMALTACFAGPVFNMLVGLGSGFAALTGHAGNASIQVTMSPSVVTGLLFLLCNCIGIVVCGSFLCGGIIPRQLGYISFILYAMYLFTSMTVQFLEAGNGFI